MQQEKQVSHCRELFTVGQQEKLRQFPGKIFDLDLLDSHQDITCLYTIQQRSNDDYSVNCHTD